MAVASADPDLDLDDFEECEGEASPGNAIAAATNCSAASVDVHSYLQSATAEEKAVMSEMAKFDTSACQPWIQGDLTRLRFVRARPAIYCFAHRHTAHVIDFPRNACTMYAGRVRRKRWIYIQRCSHGAERMGPMDCLLSRTMAT